MSVDNIWVKRLGHSDPAVRRNAISQLELIGDPEALGSLADVFAADPDPGVRDLARQAGKTIYYASIKRTLEAQSASTAERQRAAGILAKAQARKNKRRR